jgi:hypothetical protein
MHEWHLSAEEAIAQVPTIHGRSTTRHSAVRTEITAWVARKSAADGTASLRALYVKTGETLRAVYTAIRAIHMGALTQICNILRIQIGIC